MPAWAEPDGPTIRSGGDRLPKLKDTQEYKGIVGVEEVKALPCNLAFNSLTSPESSRPSAWSQGGCPQNCEVKSQYPMRNQWPQRELVQIHIKITAWEQSATAVTRKVIPALLNSAPCVQARKSMKAESTIIPELIGLQLCWPSLLEMADWRRGWEPQWILPPSPEGAEQGCQRIGLSLHASRK